MHLNLFHGDVHLLKQKDTCLVKMDRLQRIIARRAIQANRNSVLKIINILTKPRW